VSDLARALLAELSDDPATLDRLADALAERVAMRVAARSPWLSAREAADYLACPLSRVRKLTMTRELPAHHDGRRALYRREELDDFIRAGGAASP
jgi:excisionase family DNA binding protein